MAILAARMKKLLPEYTVHNFGYPTHAGVISDHSDKFLSFITSTIPEGAELNFVCHSLGSMVTRATAPRIYEKYRLNRAVLLGPPNQGAQIARVLSRYKFCNSIFGPTLKELGNPSVPHSTEFLQIGVLAGSTGIPVGFLPFLPGDNDGLVLLKETLLEGAKAHKKVLVPHPLMPFSGKLAKMAAQFIRSGEF